MQSTLEAMSFAEGLVKFCIEEDDMYWVTASSPDRRHRGAIREVGEAIRHLVRQAGDMVAVCKQELSDAGPSEFARYALSAARHYFPRGYGHEAFLAYAALLVGVACMFHREGSTRITACAAEVLGMVVIAHVLTRRFDEEGGYAGLARVAAMCSRGQDQKSD